MLLALALACSIDAPVAVGAPVGVGAPIVDAAPTSGAAAAPAVPVWPTEGAPLSILAVPPGERVHKVYLDAGHGAAGNPGNRSALCRDEQDVTLEIARGVAERLVATGRFEVRLSRDTGALVAYPARISEAAGWGAEAFVSLHTDARGEAVAWTKQGGQACLRNDADPGFTVLWSDEDPVRAVARRRLAEAVGARMTEAGFLANRGMNYEGLYEEGASGVFVDRHTPSRRIMVLRRPAMPSIIVETHHALDVEEATRWTEARTIDAFAGALAVGLIEALGG